MLEQKWCKDLDLVIPMYILIEYSSNYLERTRNLWIDSKDWGTNFNANDKNFKSFKYKVKLLGNTVAQAAPN